MRCQLNAITEKSLSKESRSVSKETKVSNDLASDCFDTAGIGDFALMEQEERPVARIAVRVSLARGKDEDKRHSADSQIIEGKRYCDFKKFDLDLPASLANKDEDVSGFRLPWRKRPGLMEHYEAAKRGEFQHLIFFKLSRLGRNVRESLDLIEAFESLGVTIHSVKENIDCTQGAGRFLRIVLLAAAEMQSEDTADFIRAAIRTRALSRKVQHGMLPVWLKRGEENGESSYVVIPEQEAALQRIVALRMEGLGYVRIARALNEEGYRTVNGAHWTDGMVYKYLSPTWIETMRGTGYLNRDLPEGDENRIVIPDLFPPILSEEQAEALRTVQARYSTAPMTSPIAGGGTWRENKARSLEKGRSPRKPKKGRVSADSSFLLSSIVWCACCPERLYSAYSGKDESRVTPYKYVCLRARTNAEAHVDGGVSISGWSLEDAVLRVVRKALQEPPPPIEKQKPREVKQEGPTLDQIDKSIDRLFTMLDKGRISEDDYDRKYNALRSQKEMLLARREEEIAPAARDAALKLMAEAGSEGGTEGETTTITREQLRQLILLTVKSVEAPLVFEGKYVRGRGTGLRRYARVTLHFDTADGHREFLVPLYKSNFTGIKEEPEPATSFGIPMIPRRLTARDGAALVDRDQD